MGDCSVSQSFTTYMQSPGVHAMLMHRKCTHWPRLWQQEQGDELRHGLVEATALLPSE